MIVVDTNIVCYYSFPGPKTALADRLRTRDSQWCVPILWRSEFRNVLAGQVRRGGLDLASAEELLDLTEAMLRETEFAVDSRSVLRCSIDSGCTAYDSEYVALAINLNVPLVTSDRQIIEAFPAVATTLESYVDH